MDMDMDMGMSMFRSADESATRTFWYLIAGATGLTGALRLVTYLELRARLAQCHNHNDHDKLPSSTASRPRGPATQLLATSTTLLRELRHPTLTITTRYLSFLSPPPLGRSILLAAYLLTLTLLSTHNAVVSDAYYWERIGYRNAWTTMMQLPLAVLLASKASPVNWIVGVGPERLNWAHRWVARGILLTATLHGWFFYAEWARADFVELELETLPMVKYGMGAWGIFLWSCLTGFAPLRSLGYEFFVAQHVVSIVVLMWCLYKHVPDYARYWFWFAICTWAFDRAGRALLYLLRNIQFHLKKKPSGCHATRRIGYTASAVPLGNVTVLTIKGLHCKWTPGQYIYLYIPALGLLETHPYTLASAHRVSGVCTCNSAQLVIRKHSGFSKRLHNAAIKSTSTHQRPAEFTAFIAGLYGHPPRVDGFENLVLVAASTGASFTMPILEGIEGRRGCLRRVEMIVTAKGEEVEWYVERIKKAVRALEKMGVSVGVHVGRTGNVDKESRGESGSSGGRSGIGDDTIIIEDDEIRRRKSTPDKDIESAVGASACCAAGQPLPTASPVSITKYTRRVDIEMVIRDVVENAVGETSVVVCGGQVLTGRVRNLVAGLSDERAVHKGSGAQGIHLYAEEYSY